MLKLPWAQLNAKAYMGMQLQSLAWGMWHVARTQCCRSRGLWPAQEPSVTGQQPFTLARLAWCVVMLAVHGHGFATHGLLVSVLSLSGGCGDA